MISVKNLTRKLRKPRGDDQFSESRGDSALDDSDPMDIQEQEEMIISLEKMQAQQSFQWKCVFAGLLFCYASFLIYSIYQQAWFPWELRYHAYFEEDVASWMVIAADWIAVLSCFMTIVGLLHNSKDRRKWICYSCIAGLGLAVFWLYYMLRMPRFRWDVIWRPFGPLSGAGLCLYVDHLLAQSSDEVRRLRSYMYSFKAI